MLHLMTLILHTECPAEIHLWIAQNPIIFKFVQRIAREDVMSCRREITQASPTAASINNGDLSNALILDHLTPKAQELLFEAKNLKNR